MTPHENPELAAVGELLRTEARIRSPHFAGYLKTDTKK
ncbi:hypothetical protein pEaSNUABM8_00001 [Erwinia phage pEa_SNUABM_8]|nr:hypothetical protein pEaSNUABM8_00001 [Erwinia phage pEa_SNUABM_8]